VRQERNQAMKNMLGAIIRYIKGERGLVAIEWVGIAAVVILAAIVITAAIMNSASGLGAAIIDNIDTAAGDVAP